MKPFLKQVAEHYLALGDISGRVFVFPNVRASLFFRKYLSELVSMSGRPLLAPEIVTVSDLFLKGADLRCADRVSLLVELYRCYSSALERRGHRAETLDEFIFWGDVILNDFNDIDKYLVNARDIFANISDLRNIQDDYSWLSETQRRAIEAFVSHFRAEDGRLKVDMSSDHPAPKESFLRIWDLLYPIYVEFNESLRSRGLAYEGMIYRQVARTGISGDSRYVFVGLNALNECEKELLTLLQKEGRAEFCWDYSSTMIRDPHNRSSFFMEDNVKRFPQAFTPDEGETLSPPAVNLLSVPSSVGQAKRLPDILRSLAGGEDLSGFDAEDTAVVLPDEKLLVPLLNSIPPGIAAVNVTMGYPLKNSEVFVFVRALATLQMNVSRRAGEYYFYHKFVEAVFSNNVFRRLCDGDAVWTEADAAGDAGGGNDFPALDCVKKIGREAKSYVPLADLSGCRLFRMVFSPVLGDDEASSAEASERLADYLLGILELCGRTYALSDEPGVETVFLREYCTKLTRLRDMHLDIKPATFFKTLVRLVSDISVPFAGEPLEGLQIMGPLETRCLDFRNVIVLSANEGVFPRRSVSSSFIPPELRRGFSLPTYEFQDAVWAYYFYRMIQRAENLWMVYDSRTEGVQSGEESRYLKQLQYDYRLKIHRFVTESPELTGQTPEPVRKTGEDLEIIRNFAFSASSLKVYLNCPVQFYYSYVRKLKEQQDVLDSMDRSTLGTVFHSLMQQLYSEDGDGRTPRRTVTGDYLRGLLSPGGRAAIRERAKSLICENLRSIELRGQDLVTCDIIVQYAVKTISHDLKLLGESGRDSFSVIGLEREFVVPFRTGRNEFRLKGLIDRLDSFREGVVRVVDYKTGRVTDDDYRILNPGPASGRDEASPEVSQAVADKIFAPPQEDADKRGSERPEVAFQFYIYNLLLRESSEGRAIVGERRIENSVYSVARLFDGNGPGCGALSREFCDRVTERLRDTLDSIADPEESFTHSKSTASCRFCSYRMICGRL